MFAFNPSISAARKSPPVWLGRLRPESSLPAISPAYKKKGGVKEACPNCLDSHGKMPRLLTYTRVSFGSIKTF